jgi:hypothetical protein
VRHNFTVEATLDAVTGAVLASQVDHVQSRDQMPWQRWDRDALLAFIEERMGVTPTGVAERRADRHDAIRHGGPSGAQPVTTLHSFAMVPQPGLRCERWGAVRARVSFDPDALDLDPTDSAHARVRVFLRRGATIKADLIGSESTPIVSSGQVSVVVPCRIPSEGCDGTLFAVVEVRTSRGVPAPTPSLPNATFVLLD